MSTSVITLQALPRDKKKGLKDLQRDSLVPGILYGHQVKNQLVECDNRGFHKVFKKAGESTVIDLQVEGKSIPVLIHQIAYDSVTDDYIHIDFFAPNMSKEVTTNVPVRLTGESLGVKDMGGILVRNRDTITVKCLPKDLPHEIVIDISVLENLHDTVTVADLNLSQAVTSLDGGEEIIISLQPPRKEEEEKPSTAEGEEATGDTTTAEASDSNKKEEEGGGDAEEKK